jgi:hypothetical protein
MQRVVLAATLDPWRTDKVKTSGAAESVELVQRALIARGHLKQSDVSANWGYWSRLTTVAWGRFEAKMGQSGPGSFNGLPGLSELLKLGEGRFDLTNRINVGNVVQLTSEALGGNSNDGADKVNERTKEMFLEAQRIMKAKGQTGSDMVIVQGGYCAECAEDSQGTHDGGGSIDIRTKDTTQQGIDNRLAALKEVGFAAWNRTPPTFEPHIHAVAINDYQMAWATHGDGLPPAPIPGVYGGNCQVYEWKFNFDGLSGCNDRTASTSPQKDLRTWEEYVALNPRDGGSTPPPPPPPPPPPASSCQDNDYWRAQFGVSAWEYIPNSDQTQTNQKRYIFDRVWYYNMYADVRTWAQNKVATQGGSVWDHVQWHWLNYGIAQGRVGAPTFDPEYYLSSYADLRDAFGTNYQAAIDHYVVYGRNEGRRGSSLFDPGFYRACYGDLASMSNAELLEHFIRLGIEEGRQGSSTFAPAWYLAAYPDVRAAFGSNNYRGAMIHWLVNGRNEGRSGHP